MKKNLTLLMMLAAFVGVLSAQSGPKFNYQAVVRNADTLVYNQEMTVTIDVTDGTNCYSETHTATTTQNGLVSVVVGDGTPVDCGGSLGNIARIDWSKATLTATFTYDAVTLTSTAPVRPVPYALQAGCAPLTTEMIANYMRNTLTTQDAKDILNALVLYNDPLQQDLEDTIEVFMKAHKEIAVDVAKAYLEHLNAGSVQEVYDALNANTPGKDKFKELLKEFFISQRPLAKELTIWYLKNATAYDIQRAYATFQDIPTATREAFKTRLIDYMQNHHELIYAFGNYLMDNVTQNEVEAAYYYFENVNTNGVNAQVRDTLNRYIDLYLGTHSVNNDAAVTNAINHYLENHNVVLKREDPSNPGHEISPCDIKDLYDTYTHP